MVDRPCLVIPRPRKSRPQCGRVSVDVLAASIRSGRHNSPHCVLFRLGRPAAENLGQSAESCAQIWAEEEKNELRTPGLVFRLP
jgi:hypothetical protein